MLKKIIDDKFIKFILVGIINTITGSGVMFILYNAAKCSYWFSSAMNYVTGSIVSFFLNKYFTFKNKERSLKQIAYFILNIFICYITAYGLSKYVITIILSSYSPSFAENTAMFAGMCIFTILNYLSQRFFVFKQP